MHLRNCYLCLLSTWLVACSIAQPAPVPPSQPVPPASAVITTAQPATQTAQPSIAATLIVPATVALLPPEPAPASASEFRTDFSRHTVPYDQILSGGPPKDGIPAIDAPTFVDVGTANSWLAPQEPVIFLQIGDDARAYPLQILTWHEIVNDTIGDVPVTITFCPLCNTAIAFERIVAGTTLDFGTTGRLRYSNLIMYDRQTESWWQQANGSAIAGQYAGTRLQTLPAIIVSWAEFQANHPAGRVLSRNTGHDREYGRNPYPGYDDINASPFLYDGPVTPNTLPASARVLAIEQGNEAVAYPYQLLQEVRAVNDTLAGEPIVVLWQAGTASALDAGTIAEGRMVGAAAAYSRRVNAQTLTFLRDGDQLIDQETGSTWDIFGKAITGSLAGTQLAPVVSINHLWFSWVAFKPETRVYQR
jgi:hypothetical protein